MKLVCVILPSVTWPVLPYFSTLSHKRQDFPKNKTLLNIDCELIFSTLFFLISYSKNKWVRCSHKCILHVEYSLFLSDFYEISIFLTDFSKNFIISNFMKIRQGVAEMFSADGQRDMVNLIVAFRTFANAPKSSWR